MDNLKTTNYTIYSYCSNEGLIKKATDYKIIGFTNDRKMIIKKVGGKRNYYLHEKIYTSNTPPLFRFKWNSDLAYSIVPSVIQDIGTKEFITNFYKSIQ
jgi:hypothetical protein